MVWRIAFGVTLADFQEDLLRAVMEIYPPGHARAGELRYRTVLISVARQNGKSDIAAILGLWGLLRKAGGLTIGIASSADLATIVYNRAVKAIRGNPALAARFARLTGTRGIETTDGASYAIKAAKSAALQGLPIHTGIVDEIHLVKPELWSDMLNGTGARLNTMVIGITTAGDTNSELLASLYQTGRKAAAGDPELERFGFFLWESPEARVPESNEELLELLLPANPLLASGVTDVDAFLADVRAQDGGDSSIIRYRLNRFVEAVNGFLPLHNWALCERKPGEVFPEGQAVYSVDVTPGWGYATVAKALKVDGVTHTKLVASIVNPSQDQLQRVMLRLAKNYPSAFVMDSYQLKDLGGVLSSQGYKVILTTQTDTVNACSAFYGNVMQGRIKHAGDVLLSVQVPSAQRKNVGASFRIIPTELSGIQIDAVMATVLATLGAERMSNTPAPGIF